MTLICAPGCASSQEHTAKPSPLLDCRIGGTSARVHSDGRVEYTLTERKKSEAETNTQFVRHYQSEFQIQSVRPVIAAIDALAVARPEFGPSEGEWLTFMRHSVAAGRTSYSMSRWEVDTHPLWLGLLDEFRSSVNLDLIESLFARELAETYTAENDWFMASTIYRRSLILLVDFRGRLHVKSRASYIEDGELSLETPLSLYEAREYEQAVIESRDAWNVLAEGLLIQEIGNRTKLEVPKDWPVR